MLGLYTQAQHNLFINFPSQQFVKRGVKEGATLVYGGKRVDRPGYFFEPTIFTDVADEMWIAKEESFGPIMIISKFSSK